MAKKIEKEEDKGQLEGLLAELGKKIDQLILETKGATKEVREDMEKKVLDLHKKRNKIEEDLKAYRDKKEPQWKEAREHLNSAAGEVKKALDKLFTKKAS